MWDSLMDWLELNWMNDFCDRRPNQDSQSNFHLQYQNLIIILSCNQNRNDQDDPHHKQHYDNNHDVHWSCPQSIVCRSEVDRERYCPLSAASNITLRYWHYKRLPTLQCDMLPKWTGPGEVGGFTVIDFSINFVFTIVVYHSVHPFPFPENNK